MRLYVCNKRSHNEKIITRTATCESHLEYAVVFSLEIKQDGVEFFGFYYVP